MKVFRSFLWLVFALVPGCGFAGILLPSYSISVNKELIGVTNGCEIVDDMWEKTGEIVVISSFSGGGKRAAAFAFGVMLGLEQVTFELMNQKQSNLLDQLDLIAAVSGGAVPAVYYGVNKGSSEDWRHNFRSFLSEDTGVLVVILFALSGELVQCQFGASCETLRGLVQ
jgi:hypothetical protein